MNLRHAPACIALLILASSLRLTAVHAQAPFSEDELLCGYRDTPSTATFVFDADRHGVSPSVVVVEGSMRAWKHDMADPSWHLTRRSDGVWSLDVSNPDHSVVKPGDQFKFRVDDGRWISPLPAAPNTAAGNLVFAHTVKTTAFTAEIVAPRHIRILSLSGPHEFSTDPKLYRLTDARGIDAPIARVLRIAPDEVQIVPSNALDITRVWRIDAPGSTRRLLCSFDGWYRHLWSPKQLGANFDAMKGETTFRIFAPRAREVRLYLYRRQTDKDPAVIFTMNRDDCGVWEAVFKESYLRWWYDYTVHGDASDPGNEFFEKVPVHITDPYARVSDDSFGRARVWTSITPAPPLRNGRPRMEDVIAYEVHVEDFTLLLPGLDDKKRGRLTGFFQSGLRNAAGAKVGIDHLVDLGINVVHLLPVQEFLHHPDDEWQAAFANDAFMRSQGVAETNYDWGYRTTHAFAIESRYREKGSDHGEQNAQFRDLVKAFHERGIAVIVDFVFNHTGERMDGREMYFNFRVLDRPGYYRTGDDVQFLGDYGTETKSEDRPMTARWIQDQCLHFIREFGVDGFRIDLAGLTDKQTLRELRRVLGPDIIIYGEPWIASGDPAYEANPDRNWYKEDAPITFFQDDTRNALCGPPDSPRNKRTDRGYAGGNGNREAAKRAIANSFPEEHTPNDGINYLDIHDNWALADRFAARDWNGLLGVDEGPYRIAAAMLLTSLGPVVIHGGSEFMRSKGAAPDTGMTRRTRSGPIVINGRRDTYNLRTPNLFVWENLGRNKTDGAACDHGRMNAWWRGLIALRKSPYGAGCRVGDRQAPDHVQFIEPPDSLHLGYVIGGTLFVLINTGTREAGIDIATLPEGRWALVADGDVAGTDPITGRPDSILNGGRKTTITLPAESVKIWVRTGK